MIDLIIDQIEMYQALDEGYFEEIGDCFVLYHVTNGLNESSILENGLVSRIGFRSEKLNESAGVYLFTSFDAMETGCDTWLFDELDIEHERLTGEEECDVILVTLHVPKQVVIEHGEFDHTVGYEIKMVCGLPKEYIASISRDYF